MTNSKNLTDKEIREKILEFLDKRKENFSFSNLETLSYEISEPKHKILKAVCRNDDFYIIFDEENYQPNSGPLIGYKKIIKENRKKYIKKLKEKRAKKEPEDKEKVNKKIKNSVINRERTKTITKKLIETNSELHDLLCSKYGISLMRNNREASSRLIEINHEIESVIAILISKNSFKKEDFK
ncbi:MAG: hypothetical protein ACOCV1_03550 [Bacillota bacterium]